ncbi:PAS domain S-box protein [bacterium]|nr:MAG: PAS domain S-box protein [bacterium]
MNQEVNNRLNMWISAFPRLAGAIAIAIGTTVIAGWIFDIELLKSLHPGMVSMKANAALAFILAGTSLLLLHSSAKSRQMKRVAQSLAMFIIVIGLLTSIEYTFGWNTGIDQLLFKDSAGAAGTLHEGRMPFSAAVSFVFFGTAILVLEVRTRRGNVPSQILAISVGILGLLGLLGYIYNLPEFVGYAVHTRMAAPGAVTFIVLSIGVLALKPGDGIIGEIGDEGVGGFMARRLLPAAIGIPIVIGWITTEGENLGLFGNQFGEVIAATAYVAIALVVVWSTARSLNKVDSERRNAEKAMRESEERWRAVVNSATDAIVTVGEDGAIISWNDAAGNIFGYSSDVAVGRPVNLIVPERYRDAHRAGMHRLLATGESRVIGKTVELAGLKNDGSELPIELSLSISKLGDAVMFTGIIRDITERKRVESIISESEKHFKELFDDAPVAYHELDLEGRIVRVNQTELKSLGYRVEEMLRHFVWEFLDDQEASRQSVLAKLAGTKPPAKGVERVYRRKDLTTIDVVSEDTLLRDAEGCITGIRTTLQDITELKRAVRLNAALYEISQAVHSSDNPDELYRHIHLALSSIIPANNFFIAVLTNDGKALHFPYERDEKDTGDWKDIEADDSQSLTVEVLRSKRPLLLGEKELLDRYSSSKNRVWGTAPRCWLGVPLMIREKAIGVMAVQDYDRGDVYGQKHVALLETAAGQIAIAIERKRAEQERESLIKGLKTALENVRTLDGLVPICAHCKKIRDDKGYWNQLEKYIVDHTDAKLTHGLCPDCAELYFPGLVPKT